MRTMTTSSSSRVNPFAGPAGDFSCSLSVPPGPCGPRNINAGLQASASFEITSTTRRTTGGFPPRRQAGGRWVVTTDPYYGSGTVLYLGTGTQTTAPRPALTDLPATPAPRGHARGGAGASPAWAGSSR